MKQVGWIERSETQQNRVRRQHDKNTSNSSALFFLLGLGLSEMLIQNFAHTFLMEPVCCVSLTLNLAHMLATVFRGAQSAVTTQHFTLKALTTNHLNEKLRVLNHFQICCRHPKAGLPNALARNLVVVIDLPI